MKIEMRRATAGGVTSFDRLFVSVGLGLLLVGPRPAHAQQFIELGGGWNYMSPAPEGQIYSGGFNLRASIGSQLSPHLLVRFDAFMADFQVKTQVFPPCAFPGCTHAYYDESSGGEAGLTANVLLNVDPRGIFYLTAGTGLYDLYFGPARVRMGVSAGAGIAVPIRGRFRIFAEARDHVLLGGDSGPSWLAPLTVGVRF